MVGEKLAIIEGQDPISLDADKGKPFKWFLSEFMVLQSDVYIKKVQIPSSYSPVHTWTASMQSWSDWYKKIVAATLTLGGPGGGSVSYTVDDLRRSKLWLKHIEAPTFQKFPRPISVFDLSTAKF